MGTGANETATLADSAAGCTAGHPAVGDGQARGALLEKSALGDPGCASTGRGHETAAEGLCGARE